MSIGATTRMHSGEVHDGKVRRGVTETIIQHWCIFLTTSYFLPMTACINVSICYGAVSVANEARQCRGCCMRVWVHTYIAGAYQAEKWISEVRSSVKMSGYSKSGQLYRIVSEQIIA